MIRNKGSDQVCAQSFRKDPKNKMQLSIIDFSPNHRFRYIIQIPDAAIFTSFEAIRTDVPVTKEIIEINSE
ncbi:hypothetical protein [Dyadobacter koreensis]|uniref:hypothetical protein n=1 Tax=Dyadobacter koreensis TaxID=408657 RepID=UPI001C430E90|nr:hypothetical protein [Dyadobacter koreensis]